MLAILNARYSFYSRQNGAFSSQRHDTEKVEPQMNFTVMTNHSTVLASEKGSEQVQEDKSYCETRTEPARLHLDNVAQLGRESPTIGIETCPWLSIVNRLWWILFFEQNSFLWALLKCHVFSSLFLYFFSPSTVKPLQASITYLICSKLILSFFPFLEFTLF